MLRCTIDDVLNGYPARWSTGASILGLMPTIVGIMSNSIDEVTAIAEESLFLAIAISLSSVTAFSSCLGDKMTEKPSYQDARTKYLQTVRDNILELIEQNNRKHPRGWQNTRTQDALVGIVMIGASNLVWYEFFQVTR